MALGVWNTVLLQGNPSAYLEDMPYATVTPGMLIERVNDAGTVKVQPHSVRNGIAMKFIPRENVLAGVTINDNYLVGVGPVQYYQSEPGCVFNMLLKKGESVVAGQDWAVSAGDGTLIKAASGIIAQIVADSATITNVNTITAFSNGTAVLGANTLAVGDRVRIYGRVAFPATHSTDTSIVTVKIGTTVLLATAALDVANGDSAIFELNLTIRTIGATGTFDGSGFYTQGTPGTATVKEDIIDSTTIDTTAAETITVYETWSVADPGNQAILREFVVELLQAGSSLYSTALQPSILGQFVQTVDNSVGAGSVRVAVRML